jgi:hypothetical protein
MRKGHIPQKRDIEHIGEIDIAVIGSDIGVGQKPAGQFDSAIFAGIFGLQIKPMMIYEILPRVRRVIGDSADSLAAGVKVRSIRSRILYLLARPLYLRSPRRRIPLPIE